MKTLFCTIILFLLLNNIVKAQVYVNVNAAGNNDGSSWQNAYTNLDSALRHTTSGEIWVCQGVYKPSRNPYPLFPFKSFLIDKPVQLLGGFNGTEVSAAQRDYRHYITILSGDLGIPENTSDNTACVVMIHGLTLDSTTKLDGFTITKAWYNDGPGIDSDNGAVHIYNAGMYNFSGPVVRNCTITGNFGFTGAGIYIYASSPYIIDNTISNNKACVGAGIYMEGGRGRRLSVVTG